MADASIAQPSGASGPRGCDTLVMTRAELRRLVDRLDRLTAELHHARERADHAEAEAARLRTAFRAEPPERDERMASMDPAVVVVGGPYGS